MNRLLILALGMTCSGAALLAATIPLNLPRPDNQPGNPKKPVKVYILAGQSDMVGRGDISGAKARYPPVYLSADPALTAGAERRTMSDVYGPAPKSNQTKFETKFETKSRTSSRTLSRTLSRTKIKSRVGRTSCVYRRMRDTSRADNGGYVNSRLGDRARRRTERAFLAPGVDGGRRKTYNGGVSRSGRQSRPEVRERVRLHGEQMSPQVTLEQGRFG